MENSELNQNISHNLEKMLNQMSEKCYLSEPTNLLRKTAGPCDNKQ